MELCQHTDHGWERTNEAHRILCTYCTEDTLVPRTFDYSTLKCTVCDYPYNGEVTISFDANGGEGSREPVTGIQLNQECPLPACKASVFTISPSATRWSSTRRRAATPLSGRVTTASLW